MAGTVAFVVAAGLVLLYALRGGGSYDVVAFEENGVIVWWLLALGLVLGLLPRSRPSRPALLLLGALGAYAAWTALSLIWTDSSELTYEEVARSLDYVGVAALGICLLGRRTWRMGIAGLAFGAMLVCVIAVGGRLAPSVFGQDRIDVAYHTDRLSYPFGYWNAMGAWGAMCIALSLAWSAHDPSRIRRALALALVPVAGTMAYLTYSRAAVAGTALALIALFALSRNRITATIHILIAAAGTGLAIAAVRGSSQIAHATGTHGASAVLGALVLAAALGAAAAVGTSIVGIDAWRIPRTLVRPLAAATTLVVLVAAVAVGPHLAGRAWHSFTGAPAPVSSTDPAARLMSLSGLRYPTWKVAMGAFKKHPAVGTGAGTFEFWWYEHAGTNESLRNTHNIWLENMAELGLPGLLLIIAAALSAIWVALKVRLRARGGFSAGAGAAVLAAFLVYLLHASVDWMWESTAVTVLALAGIGAVAGRLSQKRLRLSMAPRAALAFAAVAAGLLQLPGILSTTDIRRSRTAETQRNGNLALAWANAAVTAEPWSASAYAQRGLVLESAGRLGEAAADLNRAISDEPDNYSHWLVLARIETERSHVNAAVRDYLRARQLRPRSAIFALAPYFKEPGGIQGPGP